MRLLSHTSLLCAPLLPACCSSQAGFALTFYTDDLWDYDGDASPNSNAVHLVSLDYLVPHHFHYRQFDLHLKIESL